MTEKFTDMSIGREILAERIFVKELKRARKCDSETCPTGPTELPKGTDAWRRKKPTCMVSDKEARYWTYCSQNCAQEHEHDLLVSFRFYDEADEEVLIKADEEAEPRSEIDEIKDGCPAFDGDDGN